MQRFEIVADVLGKIDKTIIIPPAAKHWDLDEHKAAMKKIEEVMKSVVGMSELVKTLIYHEYPVTTVTFVQPEQPGEMHIIASPIRDQNCVSIQFSPALLGAIGDIKKTGFSAIEHEEYTAIEQVAREDVQRIFYMIVDYLDAKMCEERDWMDYLIEVVD